VANGFVSGVGFCVRVLFFFFFFFFFFFCFFFLFFFLVLLVRLRDEIGFLVGVFTSLFFTAVCFGAPHLLGRAYVFFIVPLLCARFVVSVGFVCVYQAHVVFHALRSDLSVAKVALLHDRFLLLQLDVVDGAALEAVSERQSCSGGVCVVDGAFGWCDLDVEKRTCIFGP
jgi:hypothetical protein